jgi:hypothetical protein
MIMQQELPHGLDGKKLKKYAKTFFGFGSWKADYWLVGLEERGATECKCEFCKRYHAWEKMQRDGLVDDGLADLGIFFKKCDIKNPETPDWNNQTWQAIHCICREAGFCIGELCASNSRWGGADAKKDSSHHVALIEAMPFPAPSTKEQVWPYTDWNLDYMESRETCSDRFLDTRLGILAKKFETHRPKVVITYGRALRDQIPKNSEFQTSCWEQGSVKGKSRLSHFCLTEFRWPENNKSLFICIAHPRSFRGACVPSKLGKKIQEKLAT